MIETAWRRAVSDLLSLAILGLLIYSIAADYYRRTEDRWRKQEMIDWNEQLQRDNPNVRVPTIEQGKD